MVFEAFHGGGSERSPKEICYDGEVVFVAAFEEAFCGVAGLDSVVQAEREVGAEEF